tara:strand:- start:212 stop:322 length:111 start_codon:yes stop_codon:yes gene_type:complete
LSTQANIASETEGIQRERERERERVREMEVEREKAS